MPKYVCNERLWWLENFYNNLSCMSWNWGKDTKEPAIRDHQEQRLLYSPKDQDPWPTKQMYFIGIVGMPCRCLAQGHLHCQVSTTTSSSLSSSSPPSPQPLVNTSVNIMTNISSSITSVQDVAVDTWQWSLWRCPWAEQWAWTQSLPLRYP